MSDSAALGLKAPNMEPYIHDRIRSRSLSLYCLDRSSNARWLRLRASQDVCALSQVHNDHDYHCELGYYPGSNVGYLSTRCGTEYSPEPWPTGGTYPDAALNSGVDCAIAGNVSGHSHVVREPVTGLVQGQQYQALYANHAVLVAVDGGTGRCHLGCDQQGLPRVTKYSPDRYARSGSHGCQAAAWQ